MFVSIINSCLGQNSQKVYYQDTDDIWYLKNEILINDILEQYNLAKLQIDSLIDLHCPIEPKFIATSIDILHKLNLDNLITDYFDFSSAKNAELICELDWIDSIKNRELFKYCNDNPQIVSDVELQLKLIILDFNDQYVRGNIELD
ncbi:MAG: hypothetical protein R2771_10700, partial [Saprospiraceae bacterium]